MNAANRAKPMTSSNSSCKTRLEEIEKLNCKLPESRAFGLLPQTSRLLLHHHQHTARNPLIDPVPIEFFLARIRRGPSDRERKMLVHKPDQRSSGNCQSVAVSKPLAARLFRNHADHVSS